MLDLKPFLSSVSDILARHALGPPGAFARWTRPHPDRKGPERHFGIDPYGCADAANLLHTLGRLRELGRQERDGWVATLQDLQDPETGLFREATHDPLHTTAHCLAALELFDAGPRHPLHALAHLCEPAAMESFLDGLDWAGNPWIESHRGAGIYAALVLADEVGPGWRARYVAWLAREADPATGLWRRGCVPSREDALEWVFPHLAGSFHYLFNLEHERAPLPHPAALVDTALALFERRGFPFATFVGFAEIDQVYCLARAVQQSGHRFEEARKALRGFAEEHLAFLTGLDPETDPGLDDLHALFGAVCCLAELQRALPGELGSEAPLRLVLDRRPFI